MSPNAASTGSPASPGGTDDKMCVASAIQAAISGSGLAPLKTSASMPRPASALAFSSLRQVAVIRPSLRQQALGQAVRGEPKPENEKMHRSPKRLFS